MRASFLWTNRDRPGGAVWQSTNAEARQSKLRKTKLLLSRPVLERSCRVLRTRWHGPGGCCLQHMIVMSIKFGSIFFVLGFALFVFLFRLFYFFGNNMLLPRVYVHVAQRLNKFLSTRTWSEQLKTMPGTTLRLWDRLHLESHGRCWQSPNHTCLNDTECRW